VGVVQNITDRKQAEEELRRKQAEVQALLENTPAGLVLFEGTPPYKVLAHNRYYQELFAEPFRSKGMVGLNVYEYAPAVEAECVVAVFDEVVSTKQPKSFLDFPYKSNPPEQSWFNWHMSPLILDGQVVALVSMSLNVTDRHKAEEGLQKAVEELAASNEELMATTEELQREIENRRQAEEELRKSKDELEQTVLERTAEFVKAKEIAEEALEVKGAFMANMSHELRTPMNSVIGFTSLLLLDEQLTFEQKDYLEIIRNSGESLLALINEVLDFSKLEHEKMDLELQPFNLRTIVEESLDLVATKAAEKDLELIYTFGKSAPEAIVGDPGKLRQILGNLLSNAVKFTKEGEVEVDVTSDTGQSEVHVAVRDTGIGIPQEDMGKLFQPFTQGDMSFKRGFEGTGLGLAISKKLVELMGGRIWVESEAGKGSTFHFTIPAETAPSDPKPSPDRFKDKRVLIAAGNQTLCRVLGRQVLAWGMIPMMAETTQETARLLQRDNDFDVVVIDASMDDFVYIMVERRDQWKVPFIVLEPLGRKVPPGLFQAVIAKPFKPAPLFQALQDILDKNESFGPVEKPEADEGFGGSLRILLAEDNLSNQKFVLQMLKRLGYRADTVVNGQEVLEALERQPYDVIFMDVKMPVMDGIEAARRIRERWPEDGPKIVAITAFALHGDREKCLEAGMDGYIPKPVRKEDLAEILEKYESNEA
jgi:signal transduction histidine kinase